MNRRTFMVASSLTLGTASLGGWYWSNRWRYIVIHHSAGAYGNIEHLQQVHRQRQAGDPIDAIPYHYIIGNGNGLGLGQVASDWRQRFHLWGAHVSGNNSLRNVFGIGICLIGNFEERPVPHQQFEALVDLTRRLMWRYGIPPANVTGHGLIPGESTKCPGKHFPIERFRERLAGGIQV